MENLQDLFDILIIGRIKYPKDLKLLLITEKQILRMYNGQVNLILFKDEESIVKNMRFERGSVLSFFSKIEFLINELIRLKLSIYEGVERIRLDDLLIRINMRFKLDFLKKWGAINSNIRKKMDKLLSVRNDFAHLWSEKEIKYKERFLQKNFDNFKNDAIEVWKKLVEIYKTEQSKIDIDKIIKRIKELNPFL